MFNLLSSPVSQLVVLVSQSDAGTGGRFAQIAGQSFWLLLLLIGPFLIFTMIVHWLEHKIQFRLAERFGWRSVLWTGWLGTPIHELSHAVMCKVFKHKIDELALFEPDMRSGTLGYVRHSFTPGDWFAEIGNFFIGLAPLVGGSIALSLLLWGFYPEAAQAVVAIAREDDGSVIGAVSEVGRGGVFETMTTLIGSLLTSILSFKNFVTWRFWVFMYLVLCVGGHMAPSRSDYDGASRGVIYVSVFLIGSVLLIAMLGFETSSLIELAVQLMTPIFAILALAIVLCCFATVIVFGLTVPFKKRYSFPRQ